MSELNESARSLIDEARADEDPTDSDRRRVRKALVLRIGGAAVATTIATGAATGAAAAAGAAAPAAVVAGSGALVKVLVAVGLVAFVGAATALATRDPGPGRHTEAQPAPQAAAAPADTVAPGAATAPEIPEPSAPEPSAPPDPATSAAPTAKATVVAAGAKSAAPAASAASAPPGLREEVGLLQRAQAELQAGRADAALKLLDTHQSSFADGALREERMAARVFALCESGRAPEGRAEAERFLQTFPRSPLATRVRSACANGPAK